MVSFMEKYKKKLEKNEGVNTELLPPSYFLHCGNYALNKLMTSDFNGAIPQGRLTALTGHSSSGKSLVAASVAAAVIRDGGFAFVIDSETSLDSDFMANCGVDVDSDNYQYVGVDGISQTTSVVNDILKDYKASGEEIRGVIIVDSLDMLLTETEQKRLDTKGDIGGDQGQQAKQLKGMLKTWVHSVNGLPISIICTKQPYKEQDPIKALENPWVFTPSLQFAFSQIIMFEKLQFKKEISGKKVHQGFTLKATAYKNRIGREKQTVKIEIPFDNGVDEFSGLIEIATEFGIIDKNKGWYTPVSFEGPKFQQGKAESDLDFMNMLLDEIKKVDSKETTVNADLSEYVEVEASEEKKEDKPKSRRGRKKVEEVEES